jgi:hypothetical protein
VASALLAALSMGGLAVRGRSQIKRERASTESRAAVLEGRLESLERNRAEMKRLRSEAPPEMEPLGPTRREAMLGLSAAIPDAVTLTSLVIRRDNTLEMEAMVLGTGFDAEAFRRAIEKMGISLAPSEGWTFNPSAGRLVIRGTLGSPRT